MQRTELTHGRGWLDAPAAASLARMDAARGDWLRTTSTGRERHEQEEAYRKYLAGGAFAALPGQSPHEPGLAVDCHAREWAWLLQHGEAHGWFLTIASEPWHRVYRAHRDTHQGDDMYDEKAHRQLLTAARPIKLYKQGTGIIAVGAGGGYWTIPSYPYVDLLIAWELAGPVVEREIDLNELDAMRAILKTVNPGGDVVGGRMDAALSLSEADARRLAATIADEHARRLAN